MAGPKGKGAFRAGEWSPLHQQAFDNAKAAIAGARLLSYLNYELPILLRTDACDDGAGAMLYQVADGKECPVAFMSHTFSAAEYAFSVRHIAGVDNPVADALSRLHPIPTVASSLPRVFGKHF